MSDFHAFHEASVEAISQLNRRNYNTNSVVLYVHPTTWGDAAADAETPHEPYAETPRLMGMEIIRNSNLPKNVVMAVDVELAARSNDAVAFGTLSE